MLRWKLTIPLILLSLGCGEDASTEAPDAAEVSELDAEVLAEDAAPVIDAAPTVDEGVVAIDAAPVADAEPAVDAAPVVDAEPAIDVESVDAALDAAPLDRGVEPPRGVHRIVIAGDSWSTGSVNPTRAWLDAHGFGAVEISSEETARAGTQASEWRADVEGMRGALRAAIQGEAGVEDDAELVLLYLGGNDYNFRQMDAGGISPEEMPDALDEIGADLEFLIEDILAQSPITQVVLVGYDYLHMEWFTTLFGIDLGDPSVLEYNQGLAGLEARKLGIAGRYERAHYAHNLGIWSHVMGNPISPPWSVPLADFPPGFFDAPSGPPGYAPFPGGCRQNGAPLGEVPVEALPGPIAAFDDGIHPSAEGWSVLLDNAFAQGIHGLLLGEAFLPRP